MFYYRVNRIGLIWDSEHIGISGTRTTMSQKTHLSKPLIFQPRLRSESLSDLLQVGLIPRLLAPRDHRCTPELSPELVYGAHMAPSPAPDLARSTPTNSELTKWKKSVQLGAAGCSARGLLTSMEGGRPRRVLGGQRCGQ